MAGFQASKKQGGSGTDGNIQTFNVNASHATLLAPGDALVVTGTGTTEGRSNVDTGNAITANTGVLVSVDVQIEGENLTETGLPAGKGGLIKIAMDPLQLYEMEADATLGPTQIDLNIGINATAATKVGGLSISNMTLDVATAAVTQTLPYRIVSLLPGITTGIVGDRALVRPNATTQSDGAVGIT